jgi:hypothetical protein
MRFVATVWLVPLLGICGCGGGSGPIEISGTVTYAGEPIEKGNIGFTPADGQGPSAAALIEDGQYSVSIMPGPKLVRIEGLKVIGQKLFRESDPSSPMVDVVEHIVPARYNENSGLTREITRDTRTFDFDLE